MKKQLYVALLAVVFCTAATLQAACCDGSCGIQRKERVAKTGCTSCKKSRYANGSCGMQS